MSDSALLREPALPAVHDRSETSPQLLTLALEGITADDYLCWVHDPEPPALGNRLGSVTIRAAPLGERIDAELVWESDPPNPRAAAIAAGFMLTPEAVELRCCKPTEGDANGRNRRQPLNAPIA
jgi:hypothetical protein